MPTQRKNNCFFLLVNVITTVTLVVFKTQILLQMLNGDAIYLFFKMADSTNLENKRLYNPMLYQFCIANNGVETRFWPLFCLKQRTMQWKSN